MGSGGKGARDAASALADSGGGGTGTDGVGREEDAPAPASTATGTGIFGGGGGTNGTAPGITGTGGGTNFGSSCGWGAATTGEADGPLPASGFASATALAAGTAAGGGGTGSLADGGGVDGGGTIAGLSGNGKSAATPLALKFLTNEDSRLPWGGRTTSPAGLFFSATGLREKSPVSLDQMPVRDSTGRPGGGTGGVEEGGVSDITGGLGIGTQNFQPQRFPPDFLQRFL